MSRVARWVGIAGLVAASGAAAASNNIHTRTKVVWNPAGACGIVVVRSQQDQINLPYSLPDVDMSGMVDACDDDPSPAACDYAPDPVPNPTPGEDEVEDSRRHRFFASCRQRPLDDALPNWIDEADVDASSQIEACCVPNECSGGLCPLVDPSTLAAQDVVSRSGAWSCCTHEIAERRAITSDDAQAGVDWDTTQVPAGVYVVDGYTWEPPYNLWSRRPGFVKVIDEPGDADAFPAAAIMEIADEGELGIIDGCETITISGCVDAEAGSTLDVWWRVRRPGDDGWHRVLADEPVQGGSFDIAWRPHELPMAKILVRLDVKSEGKAYTAHAPVALEVATATQCDAAPDPGVARTEEGDNLDKLACEQAPQPGCHCRASREDRGPWWFAFALTLVLPARRTAASRGRR